MSLLKPSDIPNLISMMRLIAVIPVVYLLLVQEFGWALVLFVVAGISDGLDGFLARHYGWRSRLGGLLDPLADKILLVCCFLVLGAQGLIPLWLVLAVIFRDLVIVSGGLLYHYLVAEIEAAPILMSKANTAVQILLVVAVILDAGGMELAQGLIDALIWACLFTVVVSGTQYVWIWGRQAIRRGWRSSD
ncbi:MAG: CDP-alcohol phosphatidyltransferase family protein [Thermochromatium sp.]